VHTSIFVIVVGAAACSGGGGSNNKPMSKMDSMMVEGMGMKSDPASAFGPLEVGADWQSYTKLNKASFPSDTHGGRMVDVYVNPIGLDAFKAGTEMPVGSVVVKTSKEPDGEGPLFVMEKREAGFNPEHGDWWFAIHWAEPPAGWAKRLGGPIYWRTPSKKADYCSDCHDGYDHQIGGVPDEQKTW
jgi:hypothetical protein